MGARLRLKTSVNGQDPALRTTDPNVQKIFRAMQKHGLIVADNGSDMYITGTFDTRWDNSILNPAFSLLSASDFDVIQLGWQPTSGAPALGSVSANPNPVAGGNPSSGTVTLTSAAGTNGAVVSLSSAGAAVHVPASVTVSGGATSASFAITTSAVTTQTLVSVSASYAGVTKTTTVTVNPSAPVALSAVTLNPTSLRGGGSVAGTVTLSAPAPAGGVTVTLASSKPAIAPAPASVVVAAGATSKGFAIATTRPSRNASVTITASYGGVTKTASLTVTRR
jgi:hypothetical protein